MFMKIGLVSIIAAASLALASCGERTANNAASAETNSAEANSAASNTASSSGGAPTGGVCGGIGNVQCAAATDFCQTATGQCGVADAQGACTVRPDFCTERRQPVCGCDGTTYDNACKAAQAGVNVQAEGECAGTGREANSTAAQ